MAIEALLAWSAKQSLWQQDALRRLALSPELSDADKASVLANIKQEHGIEQSGGLVCEPLSADHLQSDAHTAPRVLLASIDQVRNVNRLASDQSLPFGLNGITVVYGENGSGKSGYCRIAKKLCRARVVDDLLPNVFEQGEPAKAEALVRYTLDGEDETREETWQDGQPGPSATAHISVFDSINARLYIDKKNRIEYLPYEIELLTRFGQLLEPLEATVGREISDVDSRLRVALPTGYAPGSPVSSLLERLDLTAPADALPSLDETNVMATWTDDLQAQLTRLEREIGDDPKALADRCRRVDSVLATVVQHFTDVKEALSPTREEELEQSVRHAGATAEAALISGTELFKEEQLQHIGAEPWQLMFKHAKSCSQLVYPEVDPPATRPGDLCVLCQQPLDDDAADRLRRFEEYVAAQTKKDAELAAAARDECLTTLRSLDIRSADDVDNLLVEFRQMDEIRAGLGASAVAFARAALIRRDALIAAATTGDFGSISKLDDSVINDLSDANDAIRGETEAHDKTAKDDGNGKKRQSILTTLAERKRLSEERETVCARRDDLGLRAKLQACRRASRTNALSHQVSVLRKELITEDLEERMRAEIRELNLTHVPLAINDESRKGESRFEVRLDAEVQVASRDVLSEGEQRALGLACFLADVGGQPAKHGIIIDDPVSSLDNLRIRRVAHRLVDEAGSGRQVIVFTHNLVFFSEVLSAASAHQPEPVPVITHCVRSSAHQGFGIIHAGDEPWEGKPVNKRVILLRQQLKDLEHRDDVGSEKHRHAIKGFYTDLRETWERLVEEVLLSKVVERFGSDVKTQSLKSVIVDHDDYRTIFWAMKRVSERSGHDMAGGKDLPLPNLEEMQRDVEALEQYRLEIRDRSKKVQRERQALEKAPKAETA